MEEKKTNLGRPKLTNTRNKQVNIRLTEAEYNLLISKTSKVSRSKFFSTLLKENEVKINDPVSKEALIELKKIGNNLNQIAYQLNNKKEVYSSKKLENDFYLIRKKLYEDKRQLIKELKNK